MIGEQKLKKLSDYIFKKSTADQTEVLFSNHISRLTRFANNYIHQNVAEYNTSCQIRVVLGKKIGVASANTIDRKALLKTLEYALAIGRNQKENPDFHSLPEPQKYKGLVLYDSKTADFKPDDQAKAVATAIRLAKEKNLNGYGSFSTGQGEFFIANSLGLAGYTSATDVFFNTVVMGDDSTGYADGASRRVKDLDVATLAKNAIDKALIGRKPIKLKPGHYTVILEPLATAEMIDFLGYVGFGAKAVQEKRSFLVGKIGKKVVDKRISITEDPYHKLGFSFPFDFEGVAKKPVVLIKDGIAKGYVHDSITAYKEKKHSTGNALPAPNPYGPTPFNLVMRPGRKSPRTIIKNTKEGLLVTRFHYTNIVEPIKTIITGMTRDGLFLIKDGEIAHGVKNFRFTQSIIESFNSLDKIGNNLTLVGHGPGYSSRYAMGTIAPTVKISNFHFTGATKF